MSLATSNFNGNCILEIPLSSLFVQIIGRFEFTIRFESLGFLFAYFFENRDYFVVATRLNGFFSAKRPSGSRNCGLDLASLVVFKVAQSSFLIFLILIL